MIKETSNFSPCDTIRRKRDGGELSRAEIESFVRGVGDGTFADYQAAALLMAIFWRGMSKGERDSLTHAMLHSGRVLDFSDIAQPKVDKHSTGGVGDKTSLIIAPLVAACGGCVPMISGRGLGHTGGTLDKLEAIPNYKIDVSLDEFRRILKRVGFAMIGQTGEIAPVDKKLYSLRDVTATVECVPLIAASIMSKKLAEGLNGLVLDVKCGDGAFMKTYARARELATALCEIGRAAGVETVALVTSMDEPLGYAVGNSLEVIECLQILKNQDDARSRDLKELSVELAAQMLLVGKIVDDIDAGRERVHQALASGDALSKFIESVEQQGGDVRAVDDYALLPRAGEAKVLVSEQAGYVSSIKAETVGIASMTLGAGRVKVTDKVDASVGIELHKKTGDKVEHGEALATIHYNDAGRYEKARVLVQAAFNVADAAPSKLPLVRAVV